MTAWRSFALRRVLSRMRIGPDVVRHLTTFQRLGATLDATPPTETWHLAARTALRALRTRSTIDVSPDWLWPQWLRDQLDPQHAAFTPRGHLPVMQNVTGRNWTMVGNPGSVWEAVVDPRGLVTPALDTWSLDWWVRSSGRWRFPSREQRVRQSLVGSAPVVATELAVDGGTVTHRVYAVECVPELVAVEVGNESDQPLEVAFAVRPYNPEGLAVIEALELRGTEVAIDGHVLVRLPGRPRRAVLSTFDAGDSANLLDRDDRFSAVECRAGMAQGAFVFDLAAGHSLRAVMPIAARAPRTQLRVPGRRRVRAVIPEPERQPSAADAAGAWSARLDRGLRVELPDPRLQQAVDSNRAYLLLLHDPGSITAGPLTYHRFWFRDAAYQVAALDRWGFHEEAEDVLRSYPQRQQRDGFFSSQWREWDANGAAIWTIAEHHRLTRDDRLLAALAPCVASGARWIVDACADDRGKPPEGRGLLPAGVSAEHFGPYDAYFWDDWWALRGLRDAADIAGWCGDETSRSFALEGADRLQSDLFAATERAAERAGDSLLTAGPRRGVDAAMVGSLVSCWPLGLLPPDHKWVTRTLEVLRERFTLGPAFYQGIAHTGLGTYLTLQLAFVELLAGDRRGWERLEWLLDVATPTYTWPEAIHPNLLSGCMGDGHHGWMAADLLNFVRAALVLEDDEGVVLLPLLPDAWRGQRVAVRHAPTHHGLISYELTWEGDEARLRWDAERQVRLRAPSLDRTWRSAAQSGEATFPPPG